MAQHPKVQQFESTGFQEPKAAVAVTSGNQHYRFGSAEEIYIYIYIYIL
jgi:hypothetical protein